MEQDLSYYWCAQESYLRPMYEQGVSSVVETLPLLMLAFQPSDRVVRCMDERVARGIHAAGSLILMTTEEAEAYVRNSGTLGLTSHAGCGAMALYYRQQHNLPADAPIDANVLDQFAQQETKELAERLGVPYEGHISLEQMQGPPKLHTARVIYYVGTPEFDPGAIPRLPVGFVISRRYMSTEYALSEVELAIQIAKDPHHALGEFFCEEEPLLLIPVGDPTEGSCSLESLTEEVRPLLSKYPNLKIDGFSAPFEQFEYSLPFQAKLAPSVTVS